MITIGCSLPVCRRAWPNAMAICRRVSRSSFGETDDCLPGSKRSWYHFRPTSTGGCHPCRREYGAAFSEIERLSMTPGRWPFWMCSP